RVTAGTVIQCIQLGSENRILCIQQLSCCCNTRTFCGLNCSFRLVEFQAALIQTQAFQCGIDGSDFTTLDTANLFMKIKAAFDRFLQGFIKPRTACSNLHTIPDQRQSTSVKVAPFTALNHHDVFRITPLFHTQLQIPGKITSGLVTIAQFDQMSRNQLNVIRYDFTRVTCNRCRHSLTAYQFADNGMALTFGIDHRYLGHIRWPEMGKTTNCYQCCKTDYHAHTEGKSCAIQPYPGYSAFEPLCHVWPPGLQIAVALSQTLANDFSCGIDDKCQRQQHQCSQEQHTEMG